MQTSAPNPNAPRPPIMPELLRLPHPERDKERPIVPTFVPDPAVMAWVDATFLNAESDLAIIDHAPIAEARIGFLWTNVPLNRKGAGVLGMAELGMPGKHIGDAWTQGALDHQRREWFGCLPELMVTLYAPFFARCEAMAAAAVIDHELRHFAPKFKDGELVLDPRTERPVYRMVGHDLEEFRGTMEHFGQDWSRSRAAMRDAMSNRPYFDRETVERYIGPPVAGPPIRI